MTDGIAFSSGRREPNSARLQIGAGTARSATSGMEARSEIAATLPSAVHVSLSTSSQLSSERLVIYGRSGTVRPDAPNPSAEAADTDPARTLDRKVAEGRKEVAAIQIRQTKAAARDAGVLALLNPAGGIGFAKHAAKSLSNAMQTFGEAEKTIRRTEDESIAETAPEEVTAVAYDVYEQTSTLGITKDGRGAVDAALARLPDRQAARSAEAGDVSGSPTSATLTVSTRVEALSVVQIEDDSPVAARTAAVEATRSERMEEDAEVIKDGVSALRYLDRLITASTRRLQETGQMDLQAAREAAEARTAWHDAVADTAVAALPIVQAGYSIIPNDEA